MENLIKRNLSLVETAAEPVAANRELAPTQADDIAAVVAAARAASAGNTQAAAALTCLVVDDSRMIRKVARRMAEQHGFIVAEAENGEEAIARCRTAMPDLVLTDWDMPVMTGPEFVAALRALPGAERTRVIFCTSKSGAQDIHHGIGAGADDWIVKPFDEAGLSAKLIALGFG